jgi:catalase
VDGLGRRTAPALLGGLQDRNARDWVVSEIPGQLLDGVTKPVLVWAFQSGKNVDSTLGELVETGVRDRQA